MQQTLDNKPLSPTQSLETERIFLSVAEKRGAGAEEILNGKTNLSNNVKERLEKIISTSKMA